jgi:hypothetical protein
MGTPETTGRSQAGWTRTIFHEHFHQYQSTFADYYPRLDALNLAQGDTTGMWMLNYPFPYSSETFGAALAASSRALREAVLASPKEVRKRVSAYLKTRHRMEATVPPEPWKYLEFELWAEGVARWTEIDIAEQTSDPALNASGKELREHTLSTLLTLDPKDLGREIVYPYGAAEAMLLERCAPDWRRRYSETLSLGSLVLAIDAKKCV